MSILKGILKCPRSNLKSILKSFRSGLESVLRSLRFYPKSKSEVPACES